MSGSDDTQSNKLTIFLGLVCFAIGTLPLLTVLGILPHRQDVSGSIPWTSWLLGLVFWCTGLLVIMRGFTGRANGARGELPANAPRMLLGAYALLSIAIVFSLAVVFTWVAFGPGPRHFVVSFGGLWTVTSGVGDAIGRGAFGLVSVLFWGFLCLMVVVIMLRRRR